MKNPYPLHKLNASQYFSLVRAMDKFFADFVRWDCRLTVANEKMMANAFYGYRNYCVDTENAPRAIANAMMYMFDCELKYGADSPQYSQAYYNHVMGLVGRFFVTTDDIERYNLVRAK